MSVPVVRTLCVHACTRVAECATALFYKRGRPPRTLEERVCKCAHTRVPRECNHVESRRASNRTQRERDDPQPAADTIVAGCINPPSWYPQGRASNPKVNALDSHRVPSTSTMLRRCRLLLLLLLLLGIFSFLLFFADLPSLFLLHSLPVCPSRRACFPRRFPSSFSCSFSRPSQRISSGHERDVTAINPADTALARVERSLEPSSSFSSSSSSSSSSAASPVPILRPPVLV